METSTVETTGEQQMDNVEPMTNNQEMAADESASAHVIIDEQVIDKTRMTQSRQMTSNKTTKIIGKIILILITVRIKIYSRTKCSWSSCNCQSIKALRFYQKVCFSDRI